MCCEQAYIQYPLITTTTTRVMCLFAVRHYTLQKHGHYVDRRKLVAFEMWIWRRLEKISWVNKRTNKEILYMV